MLRTGRLLSLLTLVLVSAAPAAGGRDRLPPAGRAKITGRVAAAGAPATLRVLEEGPDGFPILLAEREVDAGPFRLTLPVPERIFRLSAVSGETVLSGDGFRPPNSIYRVSEAIRPLGTRFLKAIVLDGDGEPVAGARVVATFGLPGWEESEAISFLTRELVSDGDGEVFVTMPAGANGTLVARVGNRRSRLRRFRPIEPGPVRLRIPDRTRLSLSILPHRRIHEGTRPDARRVAVTARSGDAWEPVPGDARNERDWVGTLPAGVTRIRIEQEGLGPVEVRDEELTSEATATVGVALPRDAVADLEAVVLPPDGHPPAWVRRASCIPAPGGPPWEIEARRAGAERWISIGRLPSGGFGGCVVPPGGGGLEAGRYEVRARGRLLVPLRAEVEVEKGVSTLLHLRPEPGGGVHLVVRGRGGRPVETVDFSVLDEAGDPVAGLYSTGSLRHSERWHEGFAARGVENGGHLHLAPGRYTVVVDHGDGELSRHPVRVHAGIVTRLDVSPTASGRRDDTRIR